MVNTSGGNSCFIETTHNSCFDLLTEDEKQMVESHRLVVNFKKGEIIGKQGSFASHIIFLDKGLVKVYLEGNPKDLILKIVPSNHLIGLPSIYDGNNRFIYSVATYSDSSVSLIDISLFKQLLGMNSQFALKIINILNEDTALIYGRFFCLTMKQSHGRVADILLCLAKRVYKKDSFNLAISRGDMADLTGLSSESVIRILKEFKDNGLISVAGKDFTILDTARLEKISQLG
jgi:CRP/FNR family transcriptional regulator